MKKIFALLLAVMMIMSLVACGGGKTTTSSTTTSKTSTTTSTTSTTSTTKTADKVIGIPGVLYFINLKDGEQPPFKGIRIDGNQHPLFLNGWDFSTEKVCFIFNLNEWMYISVDPNVGGDFEVYFVKHADDQAVYDKMSIATLQDKAVASVVLTDPHDPTWSWGDAYIFQEENEPGYYDAIFTKGSKLIARMVIKMYDEEELGSLSDAQCEELMEEEIAKFKALV
jgi:hypothetical protein